MQKQKTPPDRNKGTEGIAERIARFLIGNYPKLFVAYYRTDQNGIYDKNLKIDLFLFLANGTCLPLQVKNCSQKAAIATHYDEHYNVFVLCISTSQLRLDENRGKREEIEQLIIGEGARRVIEALLLIYKDPLQNLVATNKAEGGNAICQLLLTPRFPAEKE